MWRVDVRSPCKWGEWSLKRTILRPLHKRRCGAYTRRDWGILATCLTVYPKKYGDSLASPPEPEQSAGHLQVRQKVLRLLLPADQQAPSPGQPREGALDHPPLGRRGLLSLCVSLLLADAADVLLVAALCYDRTRWLVIIALVQTQVLRNLLGRRGALHDDGIQRRRRPGTCGRFRSSVVTPTCGH